jgi:hypothetical protein
MIENSTLITVPIMSTSKSFIEANTIECSMSEIRKDHIIPVFAKHNEPNISHIDFIESTQYAISKVFNGEKILNPCKRLSHHFKVRIPEAKDKAANATNFANHIQNILEGNLKSWYLP